MGEGSKLWSQKFFRFTLGLYVVSLGFSASLFATEFVVKVKENHSLTESKKSFKAYKKTRVISEHKEGNLILIDLPSHDKRAMQQTVLHINAQPDVEYIVPNIKFHAFENVNDPEFSKQWALDKVKVTDAWNYNHGDRKVVVAVIDTGLDITHQDIAANVWTNPKPGSTGYADDLHGWNFHENNNDPSDTTSDKNPGHGTHCSGIIGAVGNNGVGISGINQAVQVMPVKFLGADGSGDLMNAAKAIDYAANNGANVISASWGAAVDRSQVGPILEAIQRAGTKGVLFVAAASNDGKNNDNFEVYPANAGFSNVISVAASDNQDQKPQWSNYGQAKVDLSSPGKDIYSTIPDNKYRNLSGTSMATPLVAGLAALMVNQSLIDGRTLKPEQLKAIMQATGAKVSIETACNCRIDANGALKSVHENALTVVPNAGTLYLNGGNKTISFGGMGGQGPYHFASSNASVGSVDDSGVFTAKAAGQTTVSVTDAAGSSASSQNIFVAPEPPKGGGSCPIKDNPLICQLLCMLNPKLPWCPGK